MPVNERLSQGSPTYALRFTQGYAMLVPHAYPRWPSLASSGLSTERCHADDTAAVT